MALYYLTRNVTQKEGKKIVDEWAEYFPNDFEINQLVML